MKARFIQTKQSRYGEWVAEVDPRALTESMVKGMKIEDPGTPFASVGETFLAIYKHLTTIDMEGRTGIEAENAARMFEKKGFTVINLGEKV